jgi:hypothetical protein
MAAEVQLPQHQPANANAANRCSQPYPQTGPSHTRNMTIKWASWTFPAN